MNQQLIPAVKKDKALVEEMDLFLDDSEHFYVWWLGQSGFLIQWNKVRALMDPYLSDSLTRKYAESKKPHTRMSERVVAPELLKGISVMSSSHNHTDHLDAETMRTVIEKNPGIKLVIPEANRDFVAARLECDREFPIGLSDGQSVEGGGFRFYGIPAKHNEIERDESGRCIYMGYVIEFGNWKIYHSGDTLHFEGMEDLLKSFHVDLALLPINGNDPARGVAGNLDGKEAAELGKAIEAGWVIPCHYDMFTFNTADVNEFARESTKLGQRFRILRGGEYFRSPDH